MGTEDAQLLQGTSYSPRYLTGLTRLAILHLVRELGWYPPVHRLDRFVQGGTRSFFTTFRRHEPGSQQGIVGVDGFAW